MRLFYTLNLHIQYFMLPFFILLHRNCIRITVTLFGLKCFIIRTEFTEKEIYSLQEHANKFLIGNTGFWKRAKCIYLLCFNAAIGYLFLNYCKEI